MREFMLLVRNQQDHQTGWSAERERQFVEQCMAYIGDRKKQGELISAQPLSKEGKVFAGSKGTWRIELYNESNEVILGYYHILAENIDDAIAIPQRNPEFEYSTTA